MARRQLHARSDLLVAAALGLGCWLLFVANCRVIASADSLATALAPFALWSGEGLELDASVEQGGLQGIYCFTRDRRGHWRNAYPPGTTLLAAPLYFPVLWATDLDPLEPPALPLARLAEKYAAATLATLAVLVLYSLLRRSLARPAATLGALAFALGTPVWSVASQALWQHGPAALALLLGLRLLLTDRPGVWTSAAAGLAAALLVAVRPPDAIFAAALAAMALRRSARVVAIPFLATSAAGGLAFVAYNWSTFGAVIGGYSAFDLQFGSSLRGLLGLLSSNQGLVVYCPFLLFFLKPGSAPRDVDRVDTTLLVASWVATLLFYGCFSAWWGGEHFGARYLIDGLPILFLLGGGAWAIPRVAPRAIALLAALGVAIGIQAVGAFYFPAGDSRRVSNVEPRFLSLRRSLPYLALAAGAPPPELAPLARAPGAVEAGGRVEVRLDLAFPAPRYWTPGGWHPVEFRIENRGPGRLPARGGYGAQGAARLLLFWRSTTTPFWEASEFGLRGDLEAGASRRVVHQLVAPTVEGQYLLEAVLIEKDDRGGRVLARLEVGRVQVRSDPPGLPKAADVLFLGDFEGGDFAGWIVDGAESPAAEEAESHR